MFFRVCFLATAVAASCISTQAIAADQLEEVVVTASRTEQPISEVIGSVTVITREEIEQRQAQSLQELLRGELGIDITNQGGQGKISNIFMRGSESNHTLILVDGIRLGSATDGTTRIEYIPVDQIERIEIIRGPRSSLYGSDAMGGVIQIFTRGNRGITAAVGTDEYATHNFSSGFGFNKDNLSLSINGNYIQSDGFNSGNISQQADDDGYQNISASTRLAYKLSGLANIEFSDLYIKSYTEIDNSWGPNQVRSINTTPNLKINIIPSEFFEISLTGGVGTDKSDYLKDGKYYSHINTNKRTAGTQINLHINDQSLNIGGDYLKDIIDTEPTSYKTKERKNTAIYGQYQGKFGSQLFMLSTRQDDNDQFGTHTTSNIGWKWFAIEDLLSVNAGWGQAFVAPNFMDLYYPGYDNPDLKPETSENYEIGVSSSIKSITWSAQAYSTKVNDLIGLDSNWKPYNTSRARLRGIEIDFTKEWGRLSTSINHTLQDPRDLSTNLTLIRRARQKTQLVATYNVGSAKLTSSININGSRYDDIYDENGNPARVELGGFTTIDLLANIPLRSGFKLQLKTSNLFDKQYETVSFYNQEGRNIAVRLSYQSK